MLPKWVQEGFSDGGKMGRRLQFLCVDGDSKARHSVLMMWSYLWVEIGRASCRERV